MIKKIMITNPSFNFFKDDGTDRVHVVPLILYYLLKDQNLSRLKYRAISKMKR